MHDVGATAISIPLALVLRVGFGRSFEYQSLLVYGIPASCLIAGVVFYCLGMHRRVWRYFVLSDFYDILKAASATVALFYIVVFLVDGFQNVPRSLPAIQFLCLLCLLAGPRLLRRVVEEKQAAESAVTALRPDKERADIPVILVGCGEGANVFIRALKRKIENAPYRVMGIVDLCDDKIGRKVLGIPVVGSLERLYETLAELSLQGQRPHRLVLTARLDGPQLCALQKSAERAQIPVSRLPNLTEFRAAAEEGRLDLRRIDVEDLLRRPQISLDEDAIGGLIMGRRILVTGAGGSIGSELSRQIAERRPAELILLDNSEYNLYCIDKEISARFGDLPRRAVLVDVRELSAVRRIFRECEPHYVFHAAALKHVPLMEANAREAVCTNVFGTRNVAEAARECMALAFVQISTDKAVNPTSVMGATKRLAEYWCQSLDLATQADDYNVDAEGRSPRYMTVRFGNVLGSSGSVVPLFQDQLRKGCALTVTHPAMTRYFMTIKEAASLVLQASACGPTRRKDRGLIYVLDMGEPVLILEIAEQVIRLSGLIPHKDVPINITGCRPGEKLHEELFDAVERRIESGISGVIAAQSNAVSLPNLRAIFDRLERQCKSGDARAVADELADYFPGCRRPESVPVRHTSVHAVAAEAAA